MEVARLFNILPATLLRLPVSEFRLMVAYYRKVRDALENPDGGDYAPKDGEVLE